MHPTPDPIAPGQESVWDYPRPPACQPVRRRIRVMAGKDVLADTTAAHRVLETSHPPVYYIPARDIRMDWLALNDHRSFCEWKGKARMYDLVAPHGGVRDLAWEYPNPDPKFAAIAGHLAFYAGRAGPCFVGDEEVTPQPGAFYGGWITHDVVGPFKGGPGSMGW